MGMQVPGSPNLPHPGVFVTLQPWLGCAQAILEKYPVENCLLDVTVKKKLFWSASGLDCSVLQFGKFSSARLARASIAHILFSFRRSSSTLACGHHDSCGVPLPALRKLSMTCIACPVLILMMIVASCFFKRQRSHVSHAGLTSPRVQYWTLGGSPLGGQN